MTGHGHCSGEPNRRVHWDREAVIDLHLVDDGEVELVQNDRLGDMRRELGMALHHRYRTRPPAFVRGRKLGGAAEREGRNDLDREGGGMVVVDHDGDVGLGLRHPLLRSLESGKDPLPIRLLGLLVVDCRADRRHMRRRHSCDDPSHAATSICRPASIWVSIWPPLWLPWRVWPCRTCCDCLRPSGRRRASWRRSPPAWTRS